MMIHKIHLRWFIVILTFTLLAPTAKAVTIETVPVGNPGNAADMRYNLDQRPEGFGRVDYAYDIGKYEVTAGQYCEFLNSVAAADPYDLFDSAMDSDSWGCQITRHGINGNYYYDFSGGTVEAPGSTAANWDNRPVNFVSWGDAVRFCNWLHNGRPTGILTGDPIQDSGLTEDGSYALYGANSNESLMAITRKIGATWVIPTEDEWYKAAYHKNDGVTGNYYEYPTSSDSVPSNDLTTPDSGNNATFYAGDFTIGNPYWRTEVGEHENSNSPYGTFDQGGNIWEWNESAGTDVYSLYRGTRGGSSSFASKYLRASFRGSLFPIDQNKRSVTGFRVAYIPEPSSTTFLICGLVSLIWWRRRV